MDHLRAVQIQNQVGNLVFTRFVVLAFVLFVCFSLLAGAQSLPLDTPRFSIVPLTVEKGVPLQVMLTEKLRFKLGEPVHGRIAEPVFAFDREVIPPGTEILGKITGFKSGGTWKRISSFLSADFTPVREPQITFDTIVLEDGTRILIETAVEAGTDTLIRFNGNSGGEAAAPKPNVETNPQIKALMAASKPQGHELLKTMLWSLAPYHPQSVPVGVRYNATLLEPVDFGSAIVRNGAFDKIGSEPPSGSTIFVRLATALDSRKTKTETTVEAFLTRPLYSSDHLLAFPVGSKLTGAVVQVKSASLLHHNGEMTFTFTKIEAPPSVLYGLRTKQDVEGNLVGALVGHDLSQLRIDSEGVAHVANSKMRFLSPAISAVGLSQGFNASATSFSSALAGATEGNLLKKVVGAEPGFGLPAGIAGRMVPPVGIGLGLYGAGRSVFFNILGRGQEVRFPVGTPMEIHLD
jgi:hypothetical protein